MKGAIIGDLAAWTWEHDRDTFYRCLVSPDAKMSECGLATFAVFITGMNQYDFHNFQKYFNSFVTMHSDGLSCSPEWNSFIASGCTSFHRNTLARIYAACLILAGWQNYSDRFAVGLWNSLDLDWEGGYASSFANVIWNLRQGKSKDDIVSDLAESDDRVKTVLRWHEDHQSPGSTVDEYLSFHLNYAWRCFLYNWDFTSAMHEAMRCPDCFDRHLLGMLTGAIAEAMYGCSHCLLKEKYAVNGAVSVAINLPKSVSDEFKTDLVRLREYESEKRVFFPKNASRTNVERQTWIPWKAEGVSKDFHPEYHRRFLKSFEPGWEYRFSVYLDDGWFYLCRSFFLIARFRMVQNETGRWKITDTQRCRSESDAQNALDEVMYAIIHRWYLVSDEPEPRRLDYCRYYRWQPECPFPPDSPQGRFWHAEEIFVTDGLDIQDWKRKMLPFKDRLLEIHKDAQPQLSEDALAMAYYITELYLKWRPYDDLEWMKEY